MHFKQKILAFVMLFILLASNSFVVLGTSASSSGDSGETTSSGEIAPSGETSTSGEVSGEENYLKSIALSSSISTNKNTTITSTLRSEIDSGESDLTYVIETQPSHGTLLYEDPSIATFSYTPNNDFTGTDTFSFKSILVC